MICSTNLFLIEPMLIFTQIKMTVVEHNCLKKMPAKEKYNNDDSGNDDDDNDDVIIIIVIVI